MSEKDMEDLDETEEFDEDLISTETLHDIRDGNQTHPKINKREARMAIRDSIQQKKSQRKGALRATHKMGKGLHRVFSTIVSEILQELTNFGETGSEVSHFIPEPRNFVEVTILAENIRKPWLKATLKEIKNLINDQTFVIEDPKDGEPVTPCMDVYKAKIQSDGSLGKLKLRIVVRRGLQNKEMIGDTWSPTASMTTLKYFLAGAEKHRARVHQLYFIGAFLQANVKNRVFVKLDMRYVAYFPEYTQ